MFIHYWRSGTISEEALTTRYFGTVETFFKVFKLSIRTNRHISEVTSRHVISRSGGQASKQIVCVRGPI